MWSALCAWRIDLSSPRRRQSAGHGVDDVVNSEGLTDEECVSRALVTNRLFRRGTHQEHRDVLELWAIRQGSYELRALHNWHHEIGDDQVRAFLFGAKVVTPSTRSSFARAAKKWPMREGSNAAILKPVKPRA